MKSTMWIDGALYVLIGWFAYNQAYFSSDEAAKYIAPEMKFWLTWGIGSIALMAGSLKAYRSSTFAEHQQEVKAKNGNGNGHTETVAKS